MRQLTELDMGTGYHVLRSFYIHAVRSVIDYNFVALMHLTPPQLNKLDTIQNKYMCIILGAPQWTRLTNLREESHLVLLTTRIDQMVAGFAS